MTAKTHVLGGMAMSVGGFLLLKDNGMLIPDVSEAIQVGIILPYAIWGSTLPDLDQDKEVTARNSPINYAIQKFFNLIKAGHRSAKSHIFPWVISILLYTAIAFNYIGSNLNGTEVTIIGLILLGLFFGLFSHFILDAMTRKGINIGTVTIRLVPDTDVFGTGTHYEMIVRKVLYVITVILFILLLRG